MTLNDVGGSHFILSCFFSLQLQFLEDVKYPWKLIEQLRGVLKMSNSVNNVLELFQNWKIPKKPRQRKNPFDCPCGFEKGIYDVYLLKREADEPGQVHKVHVGPRCVDLFGTAEQAEAGLHLLPRTPLQAQFSGMYSSRYVFTVFPERGNLLFTRDTRDFLQGIFDYVFIKPSERTGGAWIIQVGAGAKHFCKFYLPCHTFQTVSLFFNVKQPLC